MANWKTVEERRAYYRELHKKHLAEWTPEQLAEHKKKTRENWIKWRENQSKEKQEEIHEKVKAGQRRRWHSLSPEKKEEQIQRLRKRYQSMTPEEKAKKKLDESRWRWELKVKAISHYSQGTMHCMNPACEVPGGSKDLLSLQIDHINGGGRQHAKQLKGMGSHLYLWLYNNNYPEGFQVLCANCNVIKKVKNREGCKDNWERYAIEYSQLQSMGNGLNKEE